MSRVLIGFGVAIILACAARAGQQPASSARGPAAVAQPRGARPLFANSVTSGREAMMLRTLWGVDELHVRYTASGSMIRFSYRVVDAAKAKVLNDKKLNPYLVVLKSGSRLEVPEAERVGKLRQTAAPENGREYWMAFTNVGRTLKPGDHVDIAIGSFHARELVVESPGPRQARNP
ncbi:MAG: hypothetical protein ACRETG_05545 [Steroidobacteraceae bacterium]